MDTAKYYKLVQLRAGHDYAEVTVKGLSATLAFEGRDSVQVLVSFLYKEELRELGQALVDAAAVME